MQTNVPINNVIGGTNNVVSTITSGFVPQGLLLTKNPIMPTGTVMQFNSANAVGEDFGTVPGIYSEYYNSIIYFNSFIGNLYIPLSILIARYTDSAVAPYIRSAALQTADLAILQEVTAGTLIVNFNGITSTATGINLSTDNSFSSMAANIQSALQAISGSPLPSATCTFDVITNSFTISNGIVDTTVNYILASGSGSTDQLAQRMKIIPEDATLSQGMPVMTPQDNMNAIIEQTTNFVGFTYNFDVTGDTNYSTIVGLTNWVETQKAANNLYAFFAWSTDPNLLVSPQSTSTYAYYLAENGYGTINSSGQITFNTNIAACAGGIDFVSALMGTGASINYNGINSVLSFANKTYSGITPLVTTQTQYNATLLNGLNFYASFSSRNNQFLWSETGSFGGSFLWLDNLYNQAWLSDAIQVAQANLLGSLLKLSFNNLSTLKSVTLQVLSQGLTNGVVEPGNTFSSSQIAQLISEAGVDISSSLTNSGYYVQIVPPSASVRQARGPVQQNTWYTNGGAVIKISNLLTYVV